MIYYYIKNYITIIILFETIFREAALPPHINNKKMIIKNYLILFKLN